MSTIEIHNLYKHFKVLNRREGFLGTMKDLFSRDYKMVSAVNGISMHIHQGEFVGFLGPNGAGNKVLAAIRKGFIFIAGFLYVIIYFLSGNGS